MKIKPVSREKDLVVQEMDDEVLIYDLNSNKAFCLNKTAGIIWQLCDGKKSTIDISQEISRKLNSDVSEEFVFLALAQLKKNQLIINDIENMFEGMSRREVIRQVGVASAVALPIVASIIAPNSANASSACVPFSNACNPPTNTCCAGSICISAGGGMTCSCMCNTPGDCITQTSCPNTNNCNANMVCAP